jgi:GntR family transcriptional regulator, transcriptional repressor for pyruvate dehydrogenase complex
MTQLKRIEKKTVLEHSIEALRDFITDGELKAGDFLPGEMELCRQLGVGRSTLREAIKTLELQGYIKKRHGIGMMVVEESDKAASEMLQLMLRRKGSTMKDLIDVRYVNEIRTAELAALNADPEDVEEIEKHLLTLKNNLSSTVEYVKADIDFHLAIAKASKNEVFYFILNSVRPLIEEMIEQTLKHHHKPEKSMKFHEKIFLYIKQKNSVTVHTII